MSEYFTQGGNITGGAAVTSSYVATGGYSGSGPSKEKDKLIKALANAMKGALKVPGDISKKSPAELVNLLKKLVPERAAMDEESSVLLKSSEAQKTVCKQLAEALNKHANMSLDTSAPLDVLCDQVSEALGSIFSGVRGEFITVAKDAKTSLGNLVILKNSLKLSYDTLMNTVNKSSDSGLKNQVQSMKVVYDGLLDVLNNQIQILSNTLNMRIDPVATTIADLSEKDKEWKSYVKGLKTSLGVPRLGHRLVFTLAGLKHGAMMANEVNQALKQIGATVSDYTSNPKLKNLEKHLTEIWEKHHNKPTMDQVAQLMATLDLIRYHHYNYPDIVAELKKRGGEYMGGKKNKKSKKGGEDIYGASCPDECDGDCYKGGEDGDIPDWAQGGGIFAVGGGVTGGNLKKLGKRMKNQKVFRKMLLRDFKRRLEDHAQLMAKSVESLAKQIGKSVPLDDSLEAFKNAFKILAGESVYRVNFYMAVSGFKTDAVSKEERARFLGDLKAARRATEPLLQNAATKNYFTGVAKALDDMVKFIDGFADRYLKPMSKLLVASPEISNVSPSTDMNDTFESVSDGVSGGKKKKKKGKKGKKKGGADPQPCSEHNDKNKCDCEGDECEKKDEHCECKAEPVAEADVAESDEEKPAADADVAESNEEKPVEPADEPAEPDEDADEKKKKKAGSWLDEVDGESAGGDAGDDYHFVSLRKVANELVFYHNVAKMRNNLKGVDKEIQDASKDYTAISGEAVGNMVVDAKKEYVEWLKDFEDESKPNSYGKWLDAWVKDKTDTTNIALLTKTGTEQIKNINEWKKAALDNVRKFKKMQLQARVNLYKTAESIDLYMIHFANAVATDPDSVRSLYDITKSLDAIADWYTDRSGCHLVRVFESMPHTKNGWGQTVNTDVDDDFKLGDMHYYKEIENMATTKSRLGNPFLAMLLGKRGDTNDLEELLKRAKQATLQVRVIDNIIKLFAQAGNKIAGKSLDSEQYMPLEMIRQNLSYYIFMSAFSMGVSEHTDDAYNKPSDELYGFDFNGGSTSTSTIARLPVPTVPVGEDWSDMDKDKATAELQSRINSFTGSMGLGTPLLGPGKAGKPGVFMRLKDKKTDGITLKEATHYTRNPNQFAKLRKNYNILEFTNTGSLSANKSTYQKKVNGGAGGNKIPSSIKCDLDAATKVSGYRWVAQNYGILMRPISNVFGKEVPLCVDNKFELDDQLFVMTVKSMVAKVFTVIAAHGVTNKPLTKYNSISNARMIMGGGKKGKKKRGGVGDLDSVPEIIPEATELYIRLPLLAEFYREVLSFKEGRVSDGEERIISMVPEMADVWQDLIEVVFDEGKQVNEGTYSELHVRKMIRAINNIYRKYKTVGEKKTISNAVNGFVAEFNRRYGVVKQKYVDEYIKDKKSRYDPKGEYNDEDTPEYDILDRNSAGSTSRRPLPSDRYDYAGESKVKPGNKFSQKWIDIVRDFRHKIDAQICRHKPSSSDYSFVHTVVQQKNKVLSAKDNLQKYKAVCDAIQASDQLNNINHYKALMFHESVVSPLATLYTLYTLLKEFCDNAAELDLASLEDKLAAYYNANSNSMDASILAAAVKDLKSLKYLNAQPTCKVTQDGRGVSDGDLDVLNYLNTLPVEDGSKEKELCAELFQRYAVNRDAAFKKMVEVIWSLGTDLSDLVHVKMESVHLICDFSKMSEYIAYVLRSVKSSLEKFRNVIDEDTIRLYEGGIKNGKFDNPASVYWLEENLVEKLLKGRDEDGINEANEKLAGCFKSLKREWRVTGGSLDNNNIPHDLSDLKNLLEGKSNDDKRKLTAYAENFRQHSVDKPMEELVYWNSLGTDISKASYENNNTKEIFPFNFLPRSVDLLEKDDAEDAARLKLMEKAFQNVLLDVADDKDIETAGEFIQKYPTKASVSAYLALVNENKDLSIVRGRMGWYSNGKDHDWKKVENAGLLVQLNQALAYYMNTCTDKGLRKLYSPLVKHFGEGSHSGEVMNGNAIDDLSQDLSQDLQKTVPAIGVPPQGSVVFASLAQSIKNVLLSRKNNTNKDPRYRVDALMDVPDHVKEVMRSSLPGFKKLFYAARMKAELLRKLVQHMNCYRNFLANKPSDAVTNSNLLENQYVDDWVYFRGPPESGGGKKKNGNPLKEWGITENLRSGSTGHPNVCKPFDPRIPGDRQEMREWYTSLLDGIKGMAHSLEKSAAGVYEELGDISPQYAELHEGFLDDYKESNRHDPVMPLSLMQLGLRNKSDEDKYASNNFMLPFYHSKETPHKLNYGARKVFGGVHLPTDSDPTFETLYGPKVLLDGYNAISSADTRLDDKVFEKAMGAHAMLMRYTLDTRNTRNCYSLNYTERDDTRSLDKRLCDPDMDYLDDDGTKKGWKTEYRPYAMQNNLNRVISLVESSDSDGAIREINKSISVDLKDIDKRSQARLYNLIDMNVVPINVHALMRDVPLVQLINYSYTFDRMVQEALVPDKCDLIDCDEKAETSTQLLNKLLLHPYCVLDDKEYNSLFHRLMTGDSALGLGRPKYLSDQVYNKVLLRSLYRMPQQDGRPDESGPGASAAQHRYESNGYRNNDNNMSLANSYPLQYLDHKSDTNMDNQPVKKLELKEVNPAGLDSTRLNALSELRFNTMLVRNLMFLVNVQRVTRKMMRDELTHIEHAVITGDKPTRQQDVLSKHMTDYEQNDTYDASRLHRPDFM